VSGDVAATRPLDFYGNWSASLCASSGALVDGDGSVSYTITGDYITFTRTDQPAAPCETVQVRLNTEYWFTGAALVGQPEPPQGNGAWLGFWIYVSLGGTSSGEALVAGQDTNDNPTTFDIDTGWVPWVTPLVTVPLNEPVQLEVTANLSCTVRYDTCANCPAGAMTAGGTMRCRLASQPFTFVGPGTYTAESPDLLIAGNVWPRVDCNHDGIPDNAQLIGNDCNNNSVLDACEIISGAVGDCNANGVPDACDIASATSLDCNGNGVPDECEPDCNNNNVPDSCDIAIGMADCNSNGIPDSCDIDGPGSSAQFAKMLAADGLPTDTFGTALAVSGDLAVIGAVVANSNSSAAYVYRHNGSSWVFEAKLTAYQGQNGTQPGAAIAVSGDTVLIGARFDEEFEGGSGAAYVFRYNGTSWAQEAKLKAAPPDHNAQFGLSVAIDGDLALIGAPYHNELPCSDDPGAAYVFRRSGTTWSQEAKLSPPGTPDAYAEFGYSVSIAGNAALVGARREDDLGAAYLYRHDGAHWWPEARLQFEGDADLNDRFGNPVILTGELVIISATGDDDIANASGAVYVFRFNGQFYDQEAKLTAPDLTDLAMFGHSIALRGDTLLVGAFRGAAPAFESGMAYLFQFAGSQWTQVAKLTASDGAAGDRFGSAVALTAHGALVGAHLDDDLGTDSGSVYVFRTTDIDLNDNGVPDPCESSPCATCPGDMNGDARRNALDIQAFVACGISGGACACANLDGSPGVETGDIAMFVDEVLLGEDCP
jgi:hypothetical protein